MNAEFHLQRPAKKARISVFRAAVGLRSGGAIAGDCCLAGFMVTTLGERVALKPCVAGQALCGQKAVATLNEDCLKLSWVW